MGVVRRNELVDGGRLRIEVVAAERGDVSGFERVGGGGERGERHRNDHDSEHSGAPGKERNRGEPGSQARAEGARQ